MDPDHATSPRRRLLDTLPDLPANLELRAMLLDPASRLVELDAGHVVIAASGATAALHGSAALGAAAARLAAHGFYGELLVPHPEAATEAPALAVPGGWAAEPAIVRVRPPTDSAQPACEPLSNAANVRPLEPGDLASLVELASTELLAELAAALDAGTVLAALDDGRPVAFAYCAWETETLADLSIDTLEPFRGRGFGAAAVSALLVALGARGKRPVWGALASNAASLGLARRLGFTVPAGTISVLTRVETS